MRIKVTEKNKPSEQALENVKKKLLGVFDKLDTVKYNGTENS